MFKKQVLHLILLVVLLAGVFQAVKIRGVLAGEFLGLSTLTWILISVLIPIIHQIYVWLAWRLELCYSWITGRFGEKGFYVYARIFFVLLAGRLVAITGLAISNQNTLDIDRTVLNILGIIFAIPALYTLYSVKKYFGFLRATGIDHFDKSYREKPLVKEGIFKFTNNAMYTFGLMVLWLPGLFAASKAALLIGLFSYVYGWVHYYCTEKPDMEKIYADK